MTEVMGQGFPRKNLESLKPKERLSDEAMGNLLSFVGNHEAKAITLILMENGNIYNRDDLYRQVMNSQGDNKGWRISRSVPFAYCSKSLAPIGLVAMEIINPDISTYGYAITDSGKELGIPLAGLLLAFSERHNISLNLLFGSTASGSKSKTIQTKEGEDIEFKKRSPSTTLKILYELLTSPTLPIRVIDLARGIGEDTLSSLPIHLTRLSELGLIQYSATEANKPYSSYKLAAAIPEEELLRYKKNKTLAQSVFDVLRNYPDQYLTLKDIYNFLPKEQIERWKSENMVHISRILSLPAQHHCVDIEKFNFLKHSEINITDEQRVVLTELLEIINRFQNQDKEIPEKGRRLAEEIISNPQRVSNLLRRAKEASSNANRSSQEETRKSILSIILSNPNGVTSKEIQTLLAAKYGKKLARASIDALSSFLTKNGAIRVKKEGSVNIFNANTENSSSA